MKKRIISLGLLATVLSFTSCVKDNESDSVVAQRQAQTEKLKADATKALSEAGLADAQAKVEGAVLKIKEQEAAIKTLQAEKQKALDAYELALAKEQHEADLLDKKAELSRAEGALELAKAQLESDKQTAWKNLEDLKLRIQREKDQVAQAIENYKGTKDREALANVQNKYGEYSNYASQLEGYQTQLISAEQAVINAENNLVDTKAAKDREIAEKNRDIVSYKKRIEFLKQYTYYSNDIDALNAQLAEASEKYEKAVDHVNNVTNSALTHASQELSEQNSKWNNRYTKFDFFKAAAFSSELSPFVVRDGGQDRKVKSVEVEKEGFVTTKKVYDLNYLPTLNVEKYNLKLDDFDNYIESQQDYLDNTLIPNRDSKKADMESKKAAYEQDKSDTSKRNDYESALNTYQQAAQDVENQKKYISDVKEDKKKLMDLRAQFDNADNKKAVKDFLENLNKLETAKAEAYLENEIAKAKRDKLYDEYSDVQSIKSGAVGVDAQINNLEQAIKDAERAIADLSGVQTQEQYVATKKAEVERLKQRIELLKKKVEAAKKAYEDALAAL